MAVKNHLIKKNCLDILWHWEGLRYHLEIWNLTIHTQLWHSWSIGILHRNFLQNRIFLENVADCKSTDFPQEQGVPQGNELSCMMFSIAMNEVTGDLPEGIGTTIYVNDLAIYFSGSYLPNAERLLQTSVHRISRWALQPGFRLSPQKTIGVQFHRKWGEQTDLILYLNNQQMIYKESVKFLGLIFDCQLNWKNHISRLRIGCIKAMSLVRTLSHLKWGQIGRASWQLTELLFVVNRLWFWDIWLC